MAVYVDNFYVTGMTYRGMKMCHMIADTRDELLQMVDAIGVDRQHIQAFGTRLEHFDICLAKRKLAVKNGAIELTFRELAAMTRNRTYENI